MLKLINKRSLYLKRSLFLYFINHEISVYSYTIILFDNEITVFTCTEILLEILIRCTKETCVSNDNERLSAEYLEKLNSLLIVLAKNFVWKLQSWEPDS